VDEEHTICIDEIEGEYDLHHEYGMIQVQQVLPGLYDGGDDEAETIDDGVLVYPIQKFVRIALIILWCEGSEE
jgi:hypothetical protein